MTTFRKLPIVAPNSKPKIHDQLGNIDTGAFIILVSLTAQPVGFNIRRAV